MREILTKDMIEASPAIHCAIDIFEKGILV
jgi:hypothetical protein